MITTLITHSGRFHADEVLSTVILTDLHPEASLVRTRDMDLIDSLQAHAITYDVGSCHDPERRVFDHHHKSASMRDETTPYSSFGLIWNHYGREWLARRGIRSDLIEATHQHLDQGFVRPIDMIDNSVLSPDSLGVAANLSISETINAMNPGFDCWSGEAEMRAFHDAVTFARIALRAHSANAAALARADARLRQAIASQSGRKIIVLEEKLPIDGLPEISEARDALFVVRPRSDDWTVSVVPVSRNSFTARKNLPATWGGMEGAALERVSGIRGGVFCHRALFMAAATSREAAIKMANAALNH